MRMLNALSPFCRDLTSKNNTYFKYIKIDIRMRHSNPRLSSLQKQIAQSCIVNTCVKWRVSVVKGREALPRRSSRGNTVDCSSTGVLNAVLKLVDIEFFLPLKLMYTDIILFFILEQGDNKLVNLVSCITANSCPPPPLAPVVKKVKNDTLLSYNIDYILIYLKLLTPFCLFTGEWGSDVSSCLVPCSFWEGGP